MITMESAALRINTTKQVTLYIPSLTLARISSKYLANLMGKLFARSI